MNMELKLFTLTVNNTDPLKKPASMKIKSNFFTLQTSVY